MKRTIKIVKRVSLTFLILILVISGVAQGLLNTQFRQSDKKILKEFKDSLHEVKISYVAIPDRMIRKIEVTHSDTLPLVVFIHGAPGSATDFINYLTDSTLQSNFNMIAYDRPGYGYSDFGNSMTSIKKQAEALQAVLNGHLDEEIHLVSHSFGGAIALRFTMDYASAVEANIMLAPALDPDHEKIFAIAYLGKFPLTRWLTPTALKVATDEKLSHVEELKKMLPLYDEIKSKVIHIHGTSDTLVPFENVAFVEEKIEDVNYEKIVIEGEDHFLPWSQFDLIKEEILSFQKSRVKGFVDPGKQP